MARAGQVTSASRSCPGAPESRAWVALSRRCSQALAPGPPPEVQAGQSTWGGWGPPTLPDSGETAWRLTSGWRLLMGLTKVSCWGLGWARVWSHPIRALREPQTSPGDRWGSIQGPDDVIRIWMNSPCSWVCWLHSGASHGGQTTAGRPGSRPPSRSPVCSSTGSVLVLRQKPGDCSGQT